MLQERDDIIVALGQNAEREKDKKKQFQVPAMDDYQHYDRLKDEIEKVKEENSDLKKEIGSQKKVISDQSKALEKIESDNEFP